MRNYVTVCSKTLAQTAKVIASFSGPDGAVAANVFYVKLATSDPTDPLTLSNICTAVHNGYSVTGALLTACIASTWTLHTVEAIDNSGTSEASFIQEIDNVGGVAGDACAPNVAKAVGWLIAAHYRGGHPRMYVPGVPLSFLDTPGGRNVTTTAQGKYLAGAGHLQTEVSTGFGSTTDMTLGTISAESGHACRVPPVFRTYIGPTTRPRLDSQRRRLGRD